MQNVGRALKIMEKIESWLRYDIDDFYHLNNENLYISAPGVRGNRYILKLKA